MDKHIWGEVGVRTSWKKKLQESRGDGDGNTRTKGFRI